jgi:hypothetical protein
MGMAALVGTRSVGARESGRPVCSVLGAQHIRVVAMIPRG